MAQYTTRYSSVALFIFLVSLLAAPATMWSAPDDLQRLGRQAHPSARLLCAV